VVEDKQAVGEEEEAEEEEVEEDEEDEEKENEGRKILSISPRSCLCFSLSLLSYWSSEGGRGEGGRGKGMA